MENMRQVCYEYAGLTFVTVKETQFQTFILSQTKFQLNTGKYIHPGQDEDKTINIPTISKQ